MNKTANIFKYISRILPEGHKEPLLPSNMLLALIIGLLFILSAPPAYGINIIDITLLFDITGGFSEPSDVSVTKSGQIYVVDGVNNKIKIFNDKGQALSSFGEKGDENGQFRFPLGIDIDDAGRIYIADSGNHRVQVFNKDAGFISKIDLPDLKGKPADPTDVAVDNSRNRLYVADNDNHRILLYDLSTMKLIKSIGEPGEQELMFRYPFFIALDNEQYLYIVDVINTRVQVINPDGLFVTFIGGWGVEKGQFFRPKGIAVDTKNKIYVTDSYMGVIQVFNTLGEFKGVLGNAKKQELQRFKTPVGICIDNHNRIYVVEMLAQKVSVYSIKTDDK